MTVVTRTGPSSPLNVTGLAPGNWSFAVQASNTNGPGATSTPSVATITSGTGTVVVPNDMYGNLAAPATPIFTNSFWTQAGVSTAPLHDNSAAIINEIVSGDANGAGGLQAYGGTAAMNIHQYNTSICLAPAGTPVEQWGFFDAQNKGSLPASFAAVLAAVPTPTGLKASSGTDGEVTIVDCTNGNVFELWQAAYYATATYVTLAGTTRQALRPAGWSACWGGMTNISGPGYFSGGTGASASECAIVGGVAGIREMQIALANGNASLSHTLNMATNTVGPAQHSQWPAQNGDGAGNSISVIQEGQWLRLDPTIDVESLHGLTHIAKVFAKTAQTHGIVVTDQSGAQSLIGESPNQIKAAGMVDPWIAMATTSTGTVTPDYTILQNFPWTSMQALVPNWGLYPGNPVWTNSPQYNIYQGSALVATATSPGIALTLINNLNGTSVPTTSYVISGTKGLQRTSNGTVVATATTAANATNIANLLNAAFTG